MSGTATVAQTAAKWWVSKIHQLQNSDKEMQTSGQFGYLNALHNNKIDKECLENFEKLLSEKIDKILREGKSLFLGAGLQAYGDLAEAAEKANIDLNVFPVFSAMLISCKGEIEVSEGYFENFYHLP